MMNDYSQGFKDGFAAGLEEGKKLNVTTLDLSKYIQYPYPIGLPSVLGQNDTCPKCGIKISGVMGYSCPSINCPSYYSTSSIGAVGTTQTESSSVGTNGSAGYNNTHKNYQSWLESNGYELGN